MGTNMLRQFLRVLRAFFVFFVFSLGVIE